MEPQLVDGLRGRRAETKARWIALLHIEPVTTPLANPGTLAFMIDDSLNAVYAALADPQPTAPVRPSTAADSSNPFIAYFLAGKQALLEALVLVQSQDHGSDRSHREAAFAELTSAIESVVGGEVDAFGQVCHPSGTTNGRSRGNGGNGHANEFAG